MTEPKIFSLYSGSKGNSTYIEYDGAAILIDAGGSFLSLSRAVDAVGGDVGKIMSVFITHEHSDHVSALETLEKRTGLPVHMTNPSAERFIYSCSQALSESIINHPPLFEEQVGGIHIKSFRANHDAAMCVGYRVSFEGSSHEFGIVTDTGHTTDKIISALSGCTHLIIEANHDVEMLKSGPYPYFLKERILSQKGHLSNEQGAQLALSLAEAGAETIVLAHISEHNNTRELALAETEGVLAGYGIRLDAASQRSPTRVI
ncbi:MAG: MBL fold metallo-hydrolase [Firmicutes bacterium]|nr:MBL fold metallo-hydrolase [Bacillota bacterium]